jgi:hypothetical protein
MAKAVAMAEEEKEAKMEPPWEIVLAQRWKGSRAMLGHVVNGPNGRHGAIAVHNVGTVDSGNGRGAANSHQIVGISGNFGGIFHLII